VSPGSERPKSAKNVMHLPSLSKPIPTFLPGAMLRKQTRIMPRKVIIKFPEMPPLGIMRIVSPPDSFARATYAVAAA
jgi:hypothetical protein